MLVGIFQLSLMNRFKKPVSRAFYFCSNIGMNEGCPQVPKNGTFEGRPRVPKNGTFEGRPRVPKSGTFEGRPQVPKFLLC